MLENLKISTLLAVIIYIDDIQLDGGEQTIYALGNNSHKNTLYNGSL